MSNRSRETVKGWVTALLLAAGLVSGAANATFIVESDGVVLDTVTGLEWERNANHGPFNWAGAVAYGTSLTLDGGGFHLATNPELQGLYNDLHVAGVCSDVNCTGNIGGFTGIQQTYWSSTEEVSGSLAKGFGLDSGFQIIDLLESISLAAWAVRPNDVDAVVPAVPEPASLLLFGLGALGLGWARRRKS